MSPHLPRTAILLAVGCLAVAVSGQDEPVPDPKPRRLSEWPELKPADKDRVFALVAQFRKDDAQVRQGAHDALVGLGDATAPLLFMQLTDQPQNVNPAICGVLDAVLDPDHAALLAREAKKPKLVLRRYVVRRLCTFADPDQLPTLKAAARDKDAEVAYHANLGLLALKQQDGLQPVLTRARRDWEGIRELASDVLPKARSPEVARWVLDTFAKAGPLDIVAGLRLLRSLMPREMAGSIRGYLDAEDHNVKKESINTLRVLHGQPAIENLSVFQAIEMAKEWKTRL